MLKNCTTSKMQFNANNAWCKRCQLACVSPYFDFHWWKHRCTEAEIGWELHLTLVCNYSTHVGLVSPSTWDSMRSEYVYIVWKARLETPWEYSPHQLFFSTERSCGPSEVMLWSSFNSTTEYLVTWYRTWRLYLWFKYPKARANVMGEVTCEPEGNFNSV